MSPRGPKEKIMAMAVVNGGDTSGRRVAASRSGDPAPAGWRAPPSARTGSPAPCRSTHGGARSRLFQNAARWPARLILEQQRPEREARRPPKARSRSLAPAERGRTGRAAPRRPTMRQQRRVAGDPAPWLVSVAAPRLYAGQDLLHPAVDDPLPVGPGVVVVDREDLGALQDLGQAGSVFTSGWAGTKLILCLASWTAWPGWSPSRSASSPRRGSWRP